MTRPGQLSLSDFPEIPGQCRICKKPLPKRRRSWCSQECVEHYRLMTDWNYIRGKILERDQYRCQRCGHEPWRGPSGRRRRHLDMHVDHIVELQDGGSFHDPANLQVLCEACHVDKTNEERRRRQGRYVIETDVEV